MMIKKWSTDVNNDDATNPVLLTWQQCQVEIIESSTRENAIEWLRWLVDDRDLLELQNNGRIDYYEKVITG